MMGLGQMGIGGSSSSSSNLSPLAPPFTVGRSNPRPNSNPLAPFTEPPLAAFPFHSSHHNWQYSPSSASRPEVYSDLESDFDSIRTAVLPSANDYSYLVSHSASPTNAHVPPLNPSVTTATDTCSFLQYSSDIPKTCVQAKPYYTPLASQPVDHAIPLMAVNEPSYDLLPSSSVASSGGNSQVDYSRSLFGLEYTPPWASFWNNRLADWEQGGTGSYVCNDYMKQGPCTADGPSKCHDVSGISRKMNVDVLWGRRSLFVTPSTGKLNDKSSSLQDTMFIRNISERTSISRASSTLQESHTQVPFLQSATNYCFHENPYGVSYDKLFPSLDSCTDNCLFVKKASPALIIRPPPTCTSSASGINDKDFGRHSRSSNQEPLLSLSDVKLDCVDSSGPILHVERSSRGFNSSSSTRKEEPSNTTKAGKEFQLPYINVPSPSVRKEELSDTAKDGKEFQLPDINVPCGFTLALDSANGFCSGENSSEGLDHFNPTVDSPCWKGTPASHFSPFDASEAITPDAQICRPCVDDNVKISCPNICENPEYQEDGYVERGSLLCLEKLPNATCLTREQSSVEVVKPGFLYPGASSSDEVQFSNDIEEKRKECDVHNDQKCDYVVKLSHTKQPALNKGDFISESEFRMCAEVADSQLNTNDASEDGTVSFYGMQTTLFSPCPEEIVDKLGKLHATESNPNMNVQMLVDTIHNLSELLLLQSSNDASAVSEQNHEVLKRVINILGTCVSNGIVDMTPTRELTFTRKCTTHHCGNFPDCDKGVIAGRLPVRKEASPSSEGPFNHDSGHEVKRNSDSSGKEVEKLNVKDDSLVQAIKGVLQEDFNGEEEMHPETLLYKNLWLEAEAALWSVSYRARFNRIKIEMEKCKLRKGNG